MAMGLGALDAQELGEVADGDAALEDGAQAVDDLGREGGEVGDSLLADALALAPSLAKQDGGFAGLVGNGFQVEGHGRMLWEQISSYNAPGMERSPAKSRAHRLIGPGDDPSSWRWTVPVQRPATRARLDRHRRLGLSSTRKPLQRGPHPNPCDHPDSLLQKRIYLRILTLASSISLRILNWNVSANSLAVGVRLKHREAAQAPRESGR